MQIIIRIIIQHSNRIEYNGLNAILVDKQIDLDIKFIQIEIEKSEILDDGAGHEAGPLETFCVHGELEEREGGVDELGLVLA